MSIRNLAIDGANPAEDCAFGSVVTFDRGDWWTGP